MLDALTAWMQGPYAGKTMLVLRALFFITLITASLILILPGRDYIKVKVKKEKLILLSVIIIICFTGLFINQLRWQLFGARNPELMRFMRRHNSRSNVEIRRGSIVDRNGSLLARDPDSRVENDPANNGSRGRRHYPLGYAAAHVVGYFDPIYGLNGIERYADGQLTGVESSAIGDISQRGKEIVGNVRVDGCDVKLTLDARLQRTAYNTMANKRGAVVVLNPANGEILSLVSTPAFDPTDPGGYYGNDQDAPFLNRAIQGRYPPGSTFKIVMALIAQETIGSPVFNCSGEGFIPAPRTRPIRDSEYYSYERNGKKWHGWGRTDLKKALVHSSNVYFAQLGQKIKVETFNEYIAKLKSNSTLPLYISEEGQYAASASKIPTLAENRPGAKSQLAIGQGEMVVTPLEVAKWTAILANNGVLAHPHIELTDDKEKYPKLRIVKNDTASEVSSMLREVVISGTGRAIDLEGLGVAGKTGTAQNPGGEDHAWFTCFTTTTTPRLVVTVLVENGGFGSKGALPIAKAILEKAQALEIIKPIGGVK